MKELALLALLVLAISVLADSSGSGTHNGSEQEDISNTGSLNTQNSNPGSLDTQNSNTGSLDSQNSNTGSLDTQNSTTVEPGNTAQQTNNASSRPRPRQRPRQRQNNRHKWRHWRRNRHRGNTAATRHTSSRNQENNSSFGQTRNSPFQDAQTAHNFLTSNLQTRVTRNERTRENRALNADMAETMCEVFNKHFYPNALGGRCL
ncbi:uncharacterized protein DDB_G0283357-like [Gigantopelta aegis]|uniref:uncharacterized protein DDB_G0283357-like n=1 Tax=Gigantopelta aegis TaxID=1735272 RepID=UPI001B88D6A3|nr:uncharacterized protein DDB_G0283357-like [Gigantopelta aegis]